MERGTDLFISLCCCGPTATSCQIGFGVRDSQVYGMERRRGGKQGGEGGSSSIVKRSEMPWPRSAAV